MAPRQFVEKPYKVQAEQYDPAVLPLQGGVCVCASDPDRPVGAAHVHAVAGPWLLAAGDWIFTDLFHGDAYQVMPADEFAAKFGSGPAEGETGGG